MTSPVQREGVAKKIIAGCFKILFPSAEARIQGIEDVVGAIGKLDADSLEGKALPRRLADAADRIADRLGRIESIEYAGLDAAERRLAVQGVEEALTKFSPSKSRILQEAITTEQLRSALAPAAERRWRTDGLGEKAVSYGRLYLTESAAYVSALVRDLPGFDSDVAWETYVATRRIDAMLERGITSVVLPKFRPGLAEEMSRFEAGYRSDVASTYRYADLFGLNLPIELRRHPVDVAYIRLRASAFPGAGGQATAEGSPAVDAALGRIATARERGRGARVLLTGSAGSGKTTISQWLAISTAQRQLPESMASWSECVPFVAQLRYAFVPGREPNYEDLIRAAAWRGSDVPGSWVRDCLDRGEAVVLFDGFDELSHHDKLRAYVWLDKLLRAHPRANFIVTSRPDSLDYGWFARRYFDGLQLMPMSEGEARECINRWFHVLISGTAAANKVNEYREQHRQLIFDFQNRPTVRDLSETPLLCAMLCAFYAHKLSDSAPESRADLYQRVVEALIHFRDDARKVDRSDEGGLTYRQKLVLLEAIAMHMTATSTTTIRVEPLSRLRDEGLVQRGDPVDLDLRAKTAREIVAEQLNGMVSVRVRAEDALTHLLSRSIVLQRVADDQAQFAHRSIQEFLTGWAYADGPIEDLVAHVLEPEWRRVIVFAASAPVQERAVSALVGAILDVAEMSMENRRDLLLLAAECLTAAGRVSQSVARRASSMIEEVLPPRSLEEARSLTGLGEELLSWLDGHHQRSPEVVSACIAAAARVGGPAAMKILARYAVSPIATSVVPALLAAWDRFDAELYAQQVLAPLQLGDHEVAVRTRPQLEALKHVTSARAVRVTIDGELADLSGLAKLDKLQELDCSQLTGLRSTAGLGALSTLRRLNLTGCHHVSDLADLAQLPNLAEVHLVDCVAVPPEQVEALAGRSSLRVLVLDGCRQVYEFAWISRLDGLRTLSLDSCQVTDLDFCSSLGNLRTLRVRSLDGVNSISGVAGCVSLRRLNVVFASTRRAPLPPLSVTLREIELGGPVYVSDVMSLAQAGGLQVLRTGGIRDLTDLGQLPRLPSLTHLVLPNCELLAQPTAPLKDLAALEVLDLSNSGIHTLDFLRNQSRLRRLYLNRCHRLSDISALGDLPMLEYVSMAGGVAGVSLDMIEELRGRAGQRLIIEHDPLDDPFAVTDYLGA
ncbi:NACHT N-terminal Helical domain 1-containing protein [Micromonospora foliorum]|uniref:NACHT N-terminal Helical domain 1-containing protein n=1 Tax=Micromonospora foliorum TaxID=2911210 RepID=UPI001EE95419|nr:NACHT domain-containing protein [Micromonospora foliorum]MCG5440512.1 NACHT domain-containing protein [Micromonospora foliorum]